jgi:ERCC4-type nuclease
VIFLTTSPNDADLLPLFNGIAQPMANPYGDFMFFGKWIAGEGVTVCGERKKLGDLLKCISDGRHLQQVWRAREAGFKHIFLILEAIIRPGRDTGLVQTRRGKDWVNAIPETDYSRLEAYLNEISWYAGVQVKQTTSPRDTVRAVIALWKMFQTAPEDHSSLQKFYEPPPPAVHLTRPSLFRRVVKELPKIGWERSQVMEQRFESVYVLVNSGREEWLQVEGLGPVIVDRARKELGCPT